MWIGSNLSPWWSIEISVCFPKFHRQDISNGECEFDKTWYTDRMCLKIIANITIMALWCRFAISECSSYPARDGVPSSGVLFLPCVCVCLSVCVLASLRENHCMKWLWNLQERWAMVLVYPIRFWGWSDQGQGQGHQKDQNRFCVSVLATLRENHCMKWHETFHERWAMVPSLSH